MARTRSGKRTRSSTSTGRAITTDSFGSIKESTTTEPVTRSPDELESKANLNIEKIEQNITSIAGDVSIIDIETIFSIDDEIIENEKRIFSDLSSNENTELVGNVAKLTSLFSRSKETKRVKTKRRELLNDFIDNFFSSNKKLIQSLKSENVINSRKILQKYGVESLLQDLTIDSTSNELDRLSNVRTPISYSSTIVSQELIASQKNFFKHIKESQSDFITLNIGLPAGLTETLRRKTSKGLSGLALEYLEINVSMRHLVFEDVVFNPLTFKFSGNVIANVFSSNAESSSLKESIENMEFSCFQNSAWNNENFENTLSFISRTTGLNSRDAKVIAYNHAISELIKSIYLTFSGVNLNKIGLKNENVVTNSQLQNINSAISQFFDLSLNDITTINEDNQIVLAPPSLDIENTGIDEADFRISSAIITDPVFGYESLYAPLDKFLPFERSQSVIFNPYEFIIDREKSSSTTIESLEKRGRIINVEDEFYLRKNSSISGLPGENELDAFQYAVSIKLVRN